MPVQVTVPPIRYISCLWFLRARQRAPGRSFAGPRGCETIVSASASRVQNGKGSVALSASPIAYCERDYSGVRAPQIPAQTLLAQRLPDEVDEYGRPSKLAPHRCSVVQCLLGRPIVSFRIPERNQEYCPRSGCAVQ